MPVRKTKVRSRNLSPADIEALRHAIRAGFPWVLHTENRTFRVTGLNLQQNILLSYVTGISAGVAVFLGGEEHPSREVVKAVKAKLAADIAEAEWQYKSVFYRGATQRQFFPLPHSGKLSEQSSEREKTILDLEELFNRPYEIKAGPVCIEPCQRVSCDTGAGVLTPCRCLPPLMIARVAEPNGFLVMDSEESSGGRQWVGQREI